MEQYIGTKLIEAEPATRGQAWARKSGLDEKVHAAQIQEMGTEEGYRVRYPGDGYESWSPKDVFEKAYLPLTVNRKLKSDKPSVSQEMVDAFIAGYQVTTMGEKCTVVRAILKNGFEIVESSACVSKENYDVELGTKICKGKIKDKVWFLLGFLLQTAVGGVDGSAVGLFDRGEHHSMTLVSGECEGCDEACEEHRVKAEKAPMKKLFISQPMKDKTDEEILAVREAAIEAAERHLGEKVEVIDSFFQGAPAEARPLWYLAKSLELLATADVAYFAKDWEKYRGCRIENECAIAYGVPTIEDYRE